MCCSTCQISLPFSDTSACPNKIPNVPVKHGVEKKVGAAQMELFSYVDVTGADLSTIKKIVKLKKLKWNN